MKKSTKTLSAAVAVASLGNLVVPAVTTFAAEQNTTDVEALVKKAEQTKQGEGMYKAWFEAQEAVIKAGQGAQYASRLSAIYDAIPYKALVKEIVDGYTSIKEGADRTARKYYELEAKVNKIQDEYKDQWDRDFLGHEVYVWADEILHNKDYAPVEEAIKVTLPKLAADKNYAEMANVLEAVKKNIANLTGDNQAYAQEQIKTYEELVKNNLFVVDSVSAITPNTVTVVLKETPGRDLTAADFKVTGNIVTNAVKGNFDSVYTLTLGTSLDNKKGTLAVNGASKDYDFTQLKINSVGAKNLRQLQINFNKTLNVYGHSQNADGTYTVDELLPQLHIWMTTEEEGATVTKSIANILGANKANWHAYVQADKKTVILQSIDGSTVTAAAGTGLGLKLNETYEVEALNVQDADGNTSDVSYVTDTLGDTLRPSFTADTKVFTDTHTLDVYFSEPVKQLKVAGSKAKVYIDGSEVLAPALTDVVDNDTVFAQSHISIDTNQLGFELTKGTHSVAIVGAEDLNGNVVSNNGKEITFTYADPADVAEVTPVVKSVSQIADNAFKLVFNTTDVKQKDNSANSIVIKNGAYDSATSTYKDIELGKDNIVAKEVPATATTPAHTEWIVAVNGTAGTDAAKLSYKNANVISRDIKLTNYTKDTSNGKDGKEYTTNLTFKKDTAAPVVSSDADALAVDAASADTINVRFFDGPFTTDGNGKIALADPVKKVTVKYTDEDGVTYSESVTPTLATDGVTMKLKITNAKMLSNSSKLIAGGAYSIVLEDGVVKDEFEASGVTGVKFGLDEEAHPFVGKTVLFKVPGASTVGDTPQTTRGMIFTGKEVADSNGTLATAVKGADKLKLKDNQIVVVFEGQVDSKTAVNKNNYTLNGKVLPAGTTIEYREDDIDGLPGNESYAIITLADNTVALTGGQDFTVANVANKAGNKMMPVADVVTLSDNTAPVAKSVTVRDSNKLVVDFSEAIALDAPDMTQLAKNFVIVANGKTISLTNAAIEDRTKLVLTLADNFDNNGDLNVKVSVKLQKNADGDMFVKDLAGNKAAEVTVSR